MDVAFQTQATPHIRFPLPSMFFPRQNLGHNFLFASMNESIAFGSQALTDA